MAIQMNIQALLVDSPTNSVSTFFSVSPSSHPFQEKLSSSLYQGVLQSGQLTGVEGAQANQLLTVDGVRFSFCPGAGISEPTA